MVLDSGIVENTITAKLLYDMNQPEQPSLLRLSKSLKPSSPTFSGSVDDKIHQNVLMTTYIRLRPHRWRTARWHRSDRMRVDSRQGMERILHTGPRRSTDSIRSGRSLAWQELESTISMFLRPQKIHIFPFFEHWTFPHNNSFPTWARCAATPVGREELLALPVSSASKITAAVIRRDSSCRLQMPRTMWKGCISAVEAKQPGSRRIACGSITSKWNFRMTIGVRCL